MALLVVSGCATTGTDAEREMRLKKAKSQFEIGIDHMDRGRYAQGLSSLLAAERLDPKNARIHAALGEAYMHRGKVDEAELHLQRALEIYPQYHDARLSLSAVYLMEGKYAQAAAESEILADDATFPATWRALGNLGVAQLGLDDLASARESLSLGYEYNRTYWPVLLSMGILEQRDGRIPEAISYFGMALDQKPNVRARAEVNYRLAEIYVSLGKRDRAIGYLRTAVTESPEGSWGKKSEEYLKILR
jgi:tetratricopeptide (TPR) repeat protein